MHYGVSTYYNVVKECQDYLGSTMSYLKLFRKWHKEHWGTSLAKSQKNLTAMFVKILTPTSYHTSIKKDYWV